MSAMRQRMRSAAFRARKAGAVDGAAAAVGAARAAVVAVAVDVAAAAHADRFHDFSLRSSLLAQRIVLAYDRTDMSDPSRDLVADPYQQIIDALCAPNAY